MRVALIILLIILFFPVDVWASSLTAKAREPYVEIWVPPDFRKGDGPWPVIVFSHGFGGCPRQSLFLMTALADAGYIVLAPEHEDAACSRRSGNMRSRFEDMRAGRAARPERPLREPESWTAETERDRAEDVLFALNSLLDDKAFKGRVDRDRVGLIGHSMGGYTALGLAGGWTDWKNDEDAKGWTFRAVVGLSPYVSPYMKGGRIKNITVPVMYQTGTKDYPIINDVKKSGGAYDLSRSPKYFIELDGADHYAWTVLEDRYRDVIAQSVLSFLNRYVRGGAEDVHPLVAGGLVSTLWREENAQDPPQ